MATIRIVKQSTGSAHTTKDYLPCDTTSDFYSSESNLLEKLSASCLHLGLLLYLEKKVTNKTSRSFLRLHNSLKTANLTKTTHLGKHQRFYPSLTTELENHTAGSLERK